MRHQGMRLGVWSLFVAIGAAGFVAMAPIGCGSDDTPASTADTGAADTGTADDTGSTTDTGSATDSGSMSETSGETGPTTLSDRATKGLAITPVMIDTSKLTLEQKELVGIGSYMVNAAGDCNSCHAQQVSGGPPKFLGGGTPFSLGGSNVVYARNLTPDATTGLKLTEDEFIAAIRTGKDHKNMGEALIVMPWPSFRWMSTRDIKGIYAYLKLIPAVANPVPNDIKGPYAAATPVPFPTKYGDGDVSRDLPAETATNVLYDDRGVAIQPLADPAGYAALSAADKTLYGRGSYLANSISDCNGCHTNPDRDLTPGATFLKVNTKMFLTGGRVFEVPPGLDAIVHQERTMSADLLGKTHGYTFTDLATFKKPFTEGQKLFGSGMMRALGWPMPWQNFKNLVDEDVNAIFTYLKTQDRNATSDKQTQFPAQWCAASTDCPMGQTCNTATKECVGRTCTADTNCAACQTCSTTCAAPSSTSTCPTNGI